MLISYFRSLSYIVSTCNSKKHIRLGWALVKSPLPAPWSTGLARRAIDPVPPLPPSMFWQTKLYLFWKSWKETYFNKISLISEDIKLTFQCDTGKQHQPWRKSADKLIECQLCEDRPCDTIIIPCGHGACYRCQFGFKKCFKCGVKIKQLQKMCFGWQVLDCENHTNCQFKIKIIAIKYVFRKLDRNENKSSETRLVLTTRLTERLIFFFGFFSWFFFNTKLHQQWSPQASQIYKSRAWHVAWTSHLETYN